MASAQEHGTIKLVALGSAGDIKGTLAKYNTSDVGHAAPASATDRRQHKPLAFKTGGKGINEGDYLMVLFNASAAGDVIESEESDARISGTLVDKDSGAMEQITLDTENLKDSPAGITFKKSGTTDFTCTNDLVDYDIGWAYKVPARKVLYLGSPDGSGKIYIYIGDDT